MEFQIAGGSVPGTDHTKPGKPGWINNQDAFHWRQTDDCLVVVVSDGCGSSMHSEFGAVMATKILANMLIEAAEANHRSGGKVGISWDRIRKSFLAHVTVLAENMGGSFSQTINDHFLFTIVGTVITPQKTFRFSIGDGVFVVNGTVINLGPFPNNQPPYVVYNLVESNLQSTQPELLRFKVEEIDTSLLNSLVIGTDGVLDLIALKDEHTTHRGNGESEVVGDISQFWLTDSYFKNADMVRRRLAVINKEIAEVVGQNTARVKGGPLPDDTTLVVIRRKPTA